MNILNSVADWLMPAGNAVEHMPYALVFKTTNWCVYNCAHCCESSGPDNIKHYIPAETIQGIIKEAQSDRFFARSVVFTGGEIFSAYINGRPQYVPTLVNYCLDEDIGVDFKTNAAWVGTKYADKIMGDLVDIIVSHAQPRTESFKRLSKMQISLSLDRFHKNPDKNRRFISDLSRAIGNIQPIPIVHISSFAGDAGLFSDMIDRLKRDGNHIEQLMLIRKGTDGITPADDDGEQILCINGNILIKYNHAELFAGGRARALPDAKENETPMFSFLSRDYRVLMAYDTIGRVTLGENSGRKIWTWWANYDGSARPIKTIRRELAQNARSEVFRHFITQRLKHSVRGK